MASRNSNKRKTPIPRIEDKEVLGPFPIIVVKHVPYFVCDENLQKITVNLVNWLMGNHMNFDRKDIQNTTKIVVIKVDTVNFNAEISHFQSFYNFDEKMFSIFY